MLSRAGSTGSPMMILVAMATMSWSSVLLTNGKERDTRRLHSITFSSLSCRWENQYIITVYALKTDKLGLNEATNPAVVGYYLWNNTLAKASIISYYKREKK